MNDDEEQSGRAQEEFVGPPSSVLGSRLASTLDGDAVPTWGELGLEDAKRVAFEWQDQRSRATWNELVVLTRAPSASEWVREIHGIVGVVGELLLVCIEAEVEKTILIRRLASEVGTKAE